MSEGEKELEAYLRTRLHPMPGAERDEIVAELRSHVLDSVGGAAGPAAISRVLDRLGPPATLAGQYTTASDLARAEKSRSPSALLRALGRAAGTSAAGLFASVGFALGYALAAALTLAALRKPMSPTRVGLWQLGPDSYSLTLGFGAAPAGREVLGWWIVPLGLAAGAFVAWATTWLGRFCLRRLRAAALPRLGPGDTRVVDR
jgi:hypothetical protein